ncbi:hypothetical protein [Methylosinus sp. PW1]|uniref:hypothetical protein n=1 Tax=Methylosinus sp. PW1 TaxID=107636 RepID=UPI0012EB55C3|nr:hypothetical protein [Methylosinus sp. PW1]
MSDDDEPGSGGGLLWYEVGHSDGYSSGETDGFENGKRRGFRNGEQAALRNLNARQDAEYRAGWRSIHINDFNAWMDLLNEERRRNAELAVEVQSLRESLAISDRRGEEHRRKLSKTQDFRRGMEQSLWTLLKAAEQGKTSRRNMPSSSPSSIRWSMRGRKARSFAALMPLGHVSRFFGKRSTANTRQIAHQIRAASSHDWPLQRRPSCDTFFFP